MKKIFLILTTLIFMVSSLAFAQKYEVPKYDSEKDIVTFQGEVYKSMGIIKTYNLGRVTFNAFKFDDPKRIRLVLFDGKIRAWVIYGAYGDRDDKVNNYVIMDKDCDGDFKHKTDMSNFIYPDCFKQ